MGDDSWKDPETAKIDLILENQGLEDEIRMRGGEAFNDDGTAPELKNAFLKHVLNFEKKAKFAMVPVRSFFPADYQLPEAGAMSAAELTAKLNEIREILAEHNVGLGFADELPPTVMYTYLAEEIIPEEMVFPPEAQVGFILDGCDGGCLECFQNKYCKRARRDDNAVK